ncbi:MAG: DUF5665 domain-containing protein [Patescibacteria group bacterium]
MAKTKDNSKKQPDANNELIEKIDELTKLIHEMKNPAPKKIITDNLIKGIVLAVGRTIGLVLLFGIFYLILTNAQIIPGLGKWIAEIVKVVNNNI